MHEPDDCAARLRDAARAELERAARQLARSGDERHDGIHRARKSVRRVRAMLALGGEAFAGSSRARTLDAALRSLCRGLSSLRDADALNDALLHLNRDAVIGPIECERLCAVVSVQRSVRLAAALQRDPDLQRRRARLVAAANVLDKLPWDQLRLKHIEAAHARSLRRVHRAGRRAFGHPDIERWHALRRRLRRLRQQESALSEACPERAFESAGLGDLAVRMGEAQDHALLLARCQRSGVFASADRAMLRRLVEPLHAAAKTHAESALAALTRR